MKKKAIIFLGALLALLLCAGCRSAAPAAETPAPVNETPTPAPAVPTPEPTLSPEEIAQEEIEGEEASRLWLTIPGIEEMAEFVSSEEEEDGERIDIYVYEDSVAIALERLHPGENDMEDLLAYIADLGGILPEEIAVEDDDVVSDEMTYPSYRLFYETGEGEDAMWHVDLYVQTDLWDLLLHTMTPVDQAEDYIEEIIGWFYTVELEAEA